MKRYASEVLAAAGIEPLTLAEALPRVDPRRVRVRVAGRCFSASWGRDIAAVVMPWGVYLRRGLEADSPAAAAPLMVHELAHMDQWRRLGYSHWVASYLGDYLRGRFSGRGHFQAYWEIGLEADARAVAGRVARP